VLGVLVFVHELGHFLVAKKAGIKVEEFSLGYPPKAFGIRYGETEYLISWLPLGGYVKVAGMSDFGKEVGTGEPWEFNSKPRWIQMSVMAAGPAMNFILAFILILGIRIGYGDYAYLHTTRVGVVSESSALYEAGLRLGDRILAIEGNGIRRWASLAEEIEKVLGKPATFLIDRDGETLTLGARLSLRPEELGIEPFIPAGVGSAAPGTPAGGIGLQPGDLIVEIDGERIETWTQMSVIIKSKPDIPIQLTWERDGAEMTAEIVPKSKQVGDETVGLIGISRLHERVPVGLGEAISRSGTEMAIYTTSIFMFIERLVSGQGSGSDLAGPVAIAQMAGQRARLGLESLMSFMALLSVNLGVLNLLPIPMLDGGHLTVMAIEAVIRRDLSQRQKEVLQQIGFAFLLLLMIYVTVNDLGRVLGM
jgi:regulator of sigma E protease